MAQVGDLVGCASTTGATAQIFMGEWDEEGVFVYQAFCDDIADYALEHQKFGGPNFNPTRMTWIKPSFAWVLYRSGYGRKKNQNRVLKVKISHKAMGQLLSQCVCKDGGGGSKGRVQWDPARDIMSCENKEPRKMLRDRAIQIGLSKNVSQFYVDHVISIQDVTELSHLVGDAHKMMNFKGRKAQEGEAAMLALLPQLPFERSYLPHCSEEVLVNLGMLPGDSAAWINKLGRGRVTN
jgi:hypothetical protein